MNAEYKEKIEICEHLKHTATTPAYKWTPYFDCPICNICLEPQNWPKLFKKKDKG